MPTMRVVQKSEIIGARIVDIHATSELHDGWLDHRIIYFTVDRGFTCNLPMAGFLWITAEVPTNAEQLQDVDLGDMAEVKPRWFGWLLSQFWRTGRSDAVKRIKARHIAGV